MRLLYILAGLDAALLGAWALTLANGPYSSVEQRRWYFDAPLMTFLLCIGLPIVLLVLGGLRRRPLRSMAAVSLSLPLIAALPYLFLSAGGV